MSAYFVSACRTKDVGRVFSMKYGKLDGKQLKYNVSKRILDDIRCQRVGQAAVAVLQRGEMIYEAFFGCQHPDSKEGLRRDAIFRIASMTKPITAVAVLLQAQRGKLKLEDEVSLYLPKYACISLETTKRYCTVPLQIWHLLTHTSGMETHGAYKDWICQMPVENKKTLCGAVDYYATLPVAYEPGTHRCYSGKASFDILARLVEVTSGTTFEEFVQKEIFEPCGMQDTTFSPSLQQWERVVGMHDYQNGRGVASQTTPGCVVDDYPVTHPLGGSGLVSTLADYVKFAQMLQNRGLVKNSRILDPQWVAKMATAQLPAAMMNDDVNQGLGVRVITGEGYPWLPAGTFGWSGAYGTHFWVDPINEITAIYMKNSRYDGGSGAVTAKHFEEDVFSSIL